ncbi:MAG: tRNA lysidine(34) synthetase TilS [Bacteroidales bacterium]|jgi:tRNA(Ile)-lysidine synthase|nr:tRNA lysidine(34) synthetase TilS [Bacteroidales bacterium]
MLEKFLEFISENFLLEKKDKLLLSLSGGIDSVALFKLLSEAKISFDAAHCNYHLRGEESNRDEIFVTELCKKHKIKLFIKHFDTEEFAVDNNVSVEMAARELRYKWYEELCEKQSFTKIATAHHLNDQAETFFINIIRNTGLNGICGIPLIRNLNKKSSNKKVSDCQIIRPLMFATREEIVQYIATDDYILDSTNETDNYLRNKIRHNIIPEFEKISPDFISNLQNSIDRFKYTKSFINRMMKNFFPMEINRKGYCEIIIPKDFSFEELSGYLYFALYDFGFNFKQLDDIAKAANKSSTNVGKKFFSNGYELLIDREYFLVKEKEERIKKKDDKIGENEKELVIEDEAGSRNWKKAFSFELSDIDFQSCFEIIFEDEIVYELMNKLEINIIPRKAMKEIPDNSNIACLDYNKIDFPLYVTRKKEGDYFYPLGMIRKKKLSDYFIDNKFDQFTKNTTFALRSSKNDILWLIGHRIDNRYKIDNETSLVLIIKIK